MANLNKLRAALRQSQRNGEDFPDDPWKKVFVDSDGRIQLGRDRGARDGRPKSEVHQGVFAYASDHMRVGSAGRIRGSSSRDVYSLCSWTSYRFFWELFRCPVGDHRITSAKFDELPVDYVLSLTATEGEAIPVDPLR